MSYTPLQYLLDRANIHDVVTQMSLSVDLKSWPHLIHSIFAAELTVDYTSVFGGAPEKISSADLAKRWEGMVGGLDGSQHITTALYIELPQPGEDVEIPTTAKVAANATVTLRRDAASGDGMVQNGGRFDVGIVRTEVEKGNPWRVDYMKATKAWNRGDMADVMGGQKARLGRLGDE